jgi:hypothetical protein
MSALCELLDEHGRAVEGDLFELYQVDVLDVFRGKLTARRALDFAERACHDPRSHLRAELLGDSEFVGWDERAFLAAEIVDNTAALFTLVAKALGQRVRPPTPAHRPTVAAAAGPQAKTLADFNLAVLTT